jgi:hypothetical protein
MAEYMGCRLMSIEERMAAVAGKNSGKDKLHVKEIHNRQPLEDQEIVQSKRAAPNDDKSNEETSDDENDFKPAVSFDLFPSFNRFGYVF